MDKKQIDRINFLAKKKKTEGLTEEESKEQKELYKIYLDVYKRQILQHSNSLLQRLSLDL